MNEVRHTFVRDHKAGRIKERGRGDSHGSRGRSLPPRELKDDSVKGTRVGSIEKPFTGEKLNHRSEMVRPISPPVAILFENNHRELKVPIYSAEQASR